MTPGLPVHFNLLQACLAIWFLSYGVVILAVEITSLWVCLMLFLGPLISFLALKHFSLKPSDQSQVTEILGINFRTDADRADKILKNILQNNISDSSENVLLLKVIAHRFAGIDAPENSLTALEECYQRGCVAVEFDVALTKDKVPILFHDSTINRMTNKCGEISNMTWDQIQSLDISTNHPFHERFEGTKVPLLEDVIKKCVEYDLRMFIDIKDPSYEMAEAICNLFDKYPLLYRRAVVSSFNPMIIYLIREKKPGIVGAMAWRPYYMSHSSYSPDGAESKRYYNSILPYTATRVADCITTWLFENIYYEFLGLSAVLINKNVITHDVINRWQSRGVRVIAWTVNVPSEKFHFSKNLRISYMTDTMAGD